MKVKRFLVSLFLVLTLIFSIISPFALALPRAGSSGFKSGGFRTSAPKIRTTPKSSTGSSFKSGTFKKATPKVIPKPTQPTTTIPNTSYSDTKRSYIPVPIPIPTFRRHYYGGYYGNSIFSMWYFIKLIIKLILLIIIIKFLIKIFKR